MSPDPPAIRPEDLGFGRLFELVPDAVIVADASSGLVVLWNPAAEAMFGWRAEEMVGAPVERIIPARHQAGHQAGMRRFAASGHGPIVDGGHPVELPALRRDGGELIIELSLAPIRHDGDGRYAIAIIRDITERRAQEAALREANRHKDDFLGVLSHELRTPLNFILGFGSILEDGVAGPLGDDQRRYLGKMMDGASRMLALVEDLLDLAKIQAGRLQLDAGPMDLGEVLAAAFAEVEPIAARKGLQATLRADVAVPVLGDPRRVAQVLTNLLGNAVKFTGAGGAIALAASVDGGFARVEVQDTGMGVAEADLDRIFEKFEQGDMSATRAAGGTGLGLAISKALVEGMGGTIGLESQPGQGSRFWFTLPLAPDAGA